MKASVCGAVWGGRPGSARRATAVHAARVQGTGAREPVQIDAREGEGAGWARGRAHYLNMPTKLVTLDVSKLTDWLNAFAT